jgi:hypothetical protein
VANQFAINIGEVPGTGMPARLVSLATPQDFAYSLRDIRTYFRKVRYLDDDAGTTSLLWRTGDPGATTERDWREVVMAKQRSRPSPQYRYEHYDPRR